jgi:protein tyrosine phosphatase type 4A
MHGKSSGITSGVEQAPPQPPISIHSRNNYSHPKKTMVGTVNNNGNSLGTIGTKPTLLDLTKTTPMRFLIMDAPRQSNLHLYIKEMRRHSVTDVVRVCEPTYQGTELSQAGMVLHDMEYPDGHSPPQPVIDEWLQLVDKVFYANPSTSSTEHKCISVHCVAGLGRAPVMVAIAMIEFGNYDPVEAVSIIRKHRRGAINEKQLLYLEGYKKTYRKSHAEAGCCVIS